MFRSSFRGNAKKQPALVGKLLLALLFFSFPGQVVQEFKELAAVNDEKGEKGDGLGDLPTRPLEADKEDLPSQDDGTEQQGSLKQAERDQTPGASGPHQENNKIAGKRRNGRALDAQLGWDQQRVKSYIDCRTDERGPKRQPAALCHGIDAA